MAGSRTSGEASTLLRKFITTPIFYVNSVPHIGHLYTAVLADTLARWYRFTGHEVKFVTGTDEHGIKIASAATKHNQPVSQFCDGVSSHFRALFDRSHISYTDYIRTTELRHYQACHALWSKLKANGHFYQDFYSGWYSVSDEAFVTSMEAMDGPNGTKISRSSGQPLEHMSEPTTKFRLSSYTNHLSELFSSSRIKVHPKPRLNDIDTYLSQQNVEDLSVSRPIHRVQWGIPVPNNPDHIVYVWLDALTNYLTVCGYGQEQALDECAKWWKSSQIIHVLGKDILKFHALYWPAFLMAAGLDAPGELVVHSHWTVNHTKMSKSLGNVVDPNAILDQFGVDAVRFYLVLNGGMENDGDWSNNKVGKVYRKELAGQLGNLYSRATSQALNPKGIFPATPPLSSTQSNLALQSTVSELPSLFSAAIECREFNRALQLVISALAHANRYFAIEEPWKDTPGSRLDVIYNAFETIRIVALLLQCVMPLKSAQLLDNLGIPLTERTILFCISPGHGASNAQPRKVKPCILFPKL